jgi:hypothetical protein
MTDSASDAVARRTRRALAKQPVESSISSGSTSITSAGIHVAATPKLIDQSDEATCSRKGFDVSAPASQGRSDLWSDQEMKELQRLVGSNTGPTGKVSWVKVVEAWKSLGHSERTKGGLTAKWRDMKSKSATEMVQGETPSIQGGTGKTSPVKGTSDSSAQAVPAARTHRVIVHAVDKGNDKPESGNQRDETAVASVDIQKKEDIANIFKEKLKLSKWIGCKPNSRKSPPRISGRSSLPLINEVDRLIERELRSKTGRKLSWRWLSIVVYAGAMTVSEIDGRQRIERRERTKEWFKNSYKEMERLQSIIGKSTAELNRRSTSTDSTSKQLSNMKMLRKRYGVETFAEITSLVEKLKERLKLLRSRVALRKEDERRCRIRLTPTKVLFRSKSGKGQDEKEMVNIEHVRKYWKGIVGRAKPFDYKNEDMVAWSASLKEVKAEDDPSDCLSQDLWGEATRKAKPWKAHGPDGLQGFWWKAFKTANAALYQLARRHLTTGDPLPEEWISEGRIILLHKSGPKHDPSNYRPIACLNTCYKLLTSFVALIVDRHVRRYNILPLEQVALRKGVWGCTHALMLDQTLVADAQYQKQRPISLAWIDYAKAFDSVPHAYIKWLLRVVKIPMMLRKFVCKLIGSWKVKYEAKDTRGCTHRSNSLSIKSGVLQGDSFSPLLFCLAMAPISYSLNSTKIGYGTVTGSSKGLQLKLSHLFYMDDLKVYANSREDLTKLLDKVKAISAAISMKLNTKKCAKAHFTPKRMRDETTESEEESNSSEGCLDIPTLEGGSTYKYLGIEQTFGLHESDTWDRVEEKCSAVVRQIWESDLTFRQKVNSYNTKVIPALRYVVMNSVRGLGKYQSVLHRADEFDKKIRRILVELKVRYKASCVARLYLATELGGYGLKSVRDALIEGTIYSWAYLCTSDELRTSQHLFTSMAGRSKRSVISDAGSVLKTYRIHAEPVPDAAAVIVAGTRFTDARALARYVMGEIRAELITTRLKEWEVKELGGRVLRSGNIDRRASFVWLQTGKLSSTAVRNVIAAQEGCLLTRAHPSCVLADKTCRACGKSHETVEHLMTGCSKWLATLYIDRHDSVARNLHYRICDKYDLKPPHYSQRVEGVMENDRVKVYWGQPVQTKSIVRHNKPDIVIFEKKEQRCTIIEVAVSWFTGIARQVDVKTNRYCVNGNWEEDLQLPYPRGDNLLRELQSEGWKVKFLPVVIGACGEVLESLAVQISDALGISTDKAEDCIERMERSAVLGSSRIIKNHLSLG